MDTGAVTRIYPSGGDVGRFSLGRSLRRASRSVKRSTKKLRKPTRSLRKISRGLKPVSSQLRKVVRRAEPLAQYGGALAPYVPGGGTAVGAGLGVLRAWGRGETDPRKLAMAGARGALPPAARAGLAVAQDLRRGRVNLATIGKAAEGFGAPAGTSRYLRAAESIRKGRPSLATLDTLSSAVGGPSFSTYGPGRIGPQRVAPRLVRTLYRGGRRTGPDFRPWARLLETRGLNPDGVTWTIKSGDTLSGIAKAIAGDATKWREIVTANPDKPKHPTWGLWLNPGDVINLPASWVAAPEPTPEPIPVAPATTPTQAEIPGVLSEVIPAAAETLPGLAAALPTFTGGLESVSVPPAGIMKIKQGLGYWVADHATEDFIPHIDFPSLDEENQANWDLREQETASAFNDWWQANGKVPAISDAEEWDQPTAGLLARVAAYGVERLARIQAEEEAKKEEPAPLPAGPTAEPTPEHSTEPEIVPAPSGGGYEEPAAPAAAEEPTPAMPAGPTGEPLAAAGKDEGGGAGVALAVVGGLGALGYGLGVFKL